MKDFEIGEKYFKEENYEKALKYFFKAYEETNDIKSKIIALYNISVCYLNMRKCEEAYKNIRKCIVLLDDVDYKDYDRMNDVIIDVKKAASIIYANIKNKNLKKSYLFAKSSTAIKTEFINGHIIYEENNIESDINIEDILKQLESDLCIVNDCKKVNYFMCKKYFQDGVKYIKQEKYQKSLLNFLKCRRLNKEHDIKVCTNIAWCYRCLNKIENSILYYQKVINLIPSNRKLESLECEAIVLTYSNLCYELLATKTCRADYNQIIKYVKEGKRFADKYGIKDTGLEDIMKIFE